MSGLIRTQMRRYAVISVRTVPRCERLVIGYPDEKTLRNLLSARSIVALGYGSRDEAEASVYRNGSAAQSLQRKSISTSVVNGSRALKDFFHLLPKDVFGSRKTQTTVARLLQQTLAAAVVALYSKNVLSAALRALISF